MRGSKPLQALGLLALLLAVALSAGMRISETLNDPNFDRASARGLLRTDPALLLYVTERIVDAGGLPPADFRADPRIEWPAETDIPGMFTVGQEFAVAWLHLLLGEGTPLHVRAVWLMSLCAALAAVGAYGLTLELTGSPRWAAFAAFLWALLPANYRTIGFVLIREDFAFPFFAVHLWLFARAVRVRSAPAIAVAALTLVAAAATWHAMGFLVLMEAAVVAAWFLRSGDNPLGGRRAWVAPLVLLIGSLVIPVLLTKRFALSLPMQVVLALTFAGWWGRRGSAQRQRLAFAVALVALLAASWVLSLAGGGGLSDYGHVVDLIVAKVATLGALPEDPNELSFGARLLWQGPFATAPLELFTLGLAAGLPALLAGLALAAPTWARGRGDAPFAVLAALTGLSFLAAFLIVRVQILPGLLAPVLAAAVLARIPSRALAGGLALLALAGQATIQNERVLKQDIGWYSWPGPERIAERVQLFDWIEAHVPADQAVAADFLNSSAILLNTGRAVVQQPKYETARSRDRIEEFFAAFFQGEPRDLYRLLRQLDCRWLVIDRPWLANNCYIGGVAMAEFFQRGPRPGTAAEAFIHNDPRVFGQVPGFRLHYVSPPELRFRSFAVYERLERRRE